MPPTAKLLAALLVLGCHSGSVGDQLVRVASYVTGVHPNDAAVGDFDGDGDFDIVVPGLVSPQLATLWNEDGVLSYRFEAPLGAGATWAVALDMNRDGIDELLLSNREWPEVLVLSAASGQWRQIGELSVAGAEMVTGADLDRDGFVDVAITRFNDNDLVLLFGDENGELGRRVDVDLQARPQSLAIVDRDGDWPLIAVSEARADTVAIVGVDASDWAVLGRVDTPAWPACLSAVDVDGDGDGEVVGAANLGDAIFVIDDLTEDPAVTVTSAGAGAFGVASLSSSVIAVSNKFADTLMLFDIVDGDLQLATELATESGPSPIYSVDLFAGEREQIVVVDSFADSVSVYEWR